MKPHPQPIIMHSRRPPYHHPVAPRLRFLDRVILTVFTFLFWLAVIVLTGKSLAETYPWMP